MDSLQNPSEVRVASSSAYPLPNKRLKYSSLSSPSPSLVPNEAPPPPDGLDSLKSLIQDLHKAINIRIDNIENKLDNLLSTCASLEKHVDLLADNRVDHMSYSKETVTLTSDKLASYHRNKAGAIVIGLSNAREEEGVLSAPPLGSNVTLITLNSEEAFPDGSWLGDEESPEMRVRSPISATDLVHIHSNCRTPEKMALTLLDYIFPREIQAESNLSGHGKHGKKQLDPLMIYGIRCHLITRFAVSDSDWGRIKLNLDSKCRTAFRRKLRGQHLHTWPKTDSRPGFVDSDDSLGGDEQPVMEGQETDTRPICNTLDGVHARVVRTPRGEIHLVQASPEEVAQIQSTQHIQVIQSDQILQEDEDGNYRPLQIVADDNGQNSNVLHAVQTLQLWQPQ